MGTWIPSVERAVLGKGHPCDAAFCQSILYMFIFVFVYLFIN